MSNTVSNSVTFVLSDAGETKALLPVMRRLEAQQFPYRIIATDTARSILQRQPQQLDNLVFNHQVNPDQMSPAESSQSSYQQALQSDVIVTGTLSQYCKNWAEWFSQAGKTVVGYYDAFWPVDANSWVNQMVNHDFLQHLTRVMVPSETVAESFKVRAPNMPISVVGQPTLEETEKTAQSIQPSTMKSQLGLDQKKPTLLWIGSYGALYDESFKLFCQSVQPVIDQYNVIISLHPHVDGQLETDLLTKMNLQNKIKILPNTITTAQALAVTDVALTQKSTTATQVLFIGLPVIFVGRVDGLDPTEVNGLAKRYFEPNQLQQALSKAVDEDLPEDLQGRLLNEFGIPLNATDNIFNTIKDTSSRFLQPAELG